MNPPTKPSERAAFQTALERLKRAQTRCTWHGLYSGICFVSAVLIFFSCLHLSNESIYYLLPVMAASLGLLVLGVVLFPRGYIKELKEVTAFRRVESIGLLMDIFPLAAGQCRQILQASLIELLPQIRPENAHLLNSAQRNALCQSLVVGRNDPEDQDITYSVAVLKALEQIGDRQALQLVRHIAMHGQNRRVHKAAHECMAILTERIERRQIGETLLRASSASETPAELLRPVTEREPVEKQLLRPGKNMPDSDNQ